jgi:hypothetical protein
MPYIDKNKRDFLDLREVGQIVNNAGELNFAITTLINGYLHNGKEDMNYQKINDVLGSLEGAKLELYRRVAVPYENEKLAINGDVYND